MGSGGSGEGSKSQHSTDTGAGAGVGVCTSASCDSTCTGAWVGALVIVPAWVYGCVWRRGICDGTYMGGAWAGTQTQHLHWCMGGGVVTAGDPGGLP